MFLGVMWQSAEKYAVDEVVKIERGYRGLIVLKRCAN